MRCARSPRAARARATRKPRDGGRSVPQPARRAAVRGRPLVAARRSRRRAGVADRVVDRDGAAAARALRRRDARGRGRRRASPAASAPSTTCSRRSRTPGASAAATSSAASAPRSSRCRRRSSCCARSRSARRAGSRRARRDRSGQSVRDDAEVAGRRPQPTRAAAGPTRTVGALVVLVNGALAAYISRGGRQLARVPAGGRAGAIDDRPGAGGAAGHAARRRRRGGLLVGEINGMPSSRITRSRRS